MKHKTLDSIELRFYSSWHPIKFIDVIIDCKILKKMCTFRLVKPSSCGSFYYTKEMKNFFFNFEL